jgi:hypothetical protein
MFLTRGYQNLLMHDKVGMECTIISDRSDLTAFADIEDQDRLMADVLKNYDFKKVAENEEHLAVRSVLQRVRAGHRSDGLRILRRGKTCFIMEYYYPYLLGSQTSFCLQHRRRAHSAQRVLQWSVVRIRAWGPR